MNLSKEITFKLLEDSLQVTDTQYRVNCPFCGETNHKAYISFEYRNLRCFKCCKQVKLLNLPSVPISKSKNFVKQVIDFPDLFPVEENKLLLDYTLTRIRDKNLIRSLGISYAPYVSRYRNRIIFPVTKYGKQVYLQARTIFSYVDLKYLNPCSGGKTRQHNYCAKGCIGETTYGKSDVIFNVDKLVLSGTREVVVCEGILSSLAIPNGVAILGKTISMEQVRMLLKAKFDKITIMLDANAELEALDVARKLINEDYKNVYVSYLKSGDPDTSNITEILTALDDAKHHGYHNIDQKTIEMQYAKSNKF